MRYTEKINETDYKLVKYNDIVRANARMKLGKLEDLMEKYGIESIEELEDTIQIKKALELAFAKHRG